MRYFPSASRRRALRRSLVVPALVGALAVPIAAYSSDTDDLREKQKDVKHQVAQAQEDAEESSNRVAKANAALKASQGRLVDAKSALRAVRQDLYAARAKDAQMQERLQAAQGRLVRAQVEVINGTKALDAQRETVRDLVVSLYTQGDPNLVSLTGYLGASTPSDLIRNEEYANTATGKQKGIFDDLAAAEAQLRTRQAEVRAARDDMADRREEAAANLAETQRLTQQAEAAKRDVLGLIAANKVNRQEAWAARKHDLELLRQLKREEARIKKKIQAAIAAAAAAATGPGFTGASDGFMNYPVNGRVTSPFGYRIHPIYGYYGLHDGTDFGAGCGQAMYAVADGTVIERYYSSVYGNRMYLNVGRVNGHSVVANYNHATSYTVSVGDKVKRGQVVGYVGSTGWSTGCHLHFTVLQDGDPVDPMGYL